MTIMIVYKITNTVNGKVYIGKTIKFSFQERWVRHCAAARRGSHFHFHNAIRKYGADAFLVEVLYRAKTSEELSKMETFFIVLHQSHKPENGYNMTLGGDGLVATEEVRKVLSVKARGRIVSEDSRRRMSEAKRGKRPKASDANLGRKHSDQRKEEISAFFQNIPRSETWRKNISKALPGIHLSEERKKNISEAKKRWWAERKAATRA